MTIATASRAPPRMPLQFTALDIIHTGGLVPAPTWACGTRCRVNRKGPVGIGPVDRRTCTVHLGLPRLDLPFSHQRNGPELVDGISTPALR